MQSCDHLVVDVLLFPPGSVLFLSEPKYSLIPLRVNNSVLKSPGNTFYLGRMLLFSYSVLERKLT